jgi:hypothetical protein
VLTTRAGHHAENLVERPHAAHRLQLIQEVFQSQRLPAHLALEIGGLLLVVDFLRLLDQGQHIAHAENALRHAIRVEGLEVVEAFADTDKLDGLAENRAQTQRRATASVAIELAEHDTGQRNALVELGRHAQGFLPSHRVEHQQRLAWLYEAANGLKLLHERIVDMRAPSRIDDDDIAQIRTRLLAPVLNNPRHVLFVSQREHRHIDLPAEDT